MVTITERERGAAWQSEKKKKHQKIRGTPPVLGAEERQQHAGKRWQHIRLGNGRMSQKNERRKGRMNSNSANL